MAHNAYLLSPTARDGTTATWPAGGTVYKEDFAWFAKGVFQSINGDLGGTWAPSSAITIGGSGLVCTTVQSQFYGVTINGAGTLVCNAGAFLNQDVTLGDTHGDTTTVNGVFIAQWHATFNDNVAFNGTGTLTVAAGVSTNINGGFNANKSVGIGTTSSDVLSVQASAGFASQVTISDNLNLNGGSSGTHATATFGTWYNVTFNCTNAVFFAGGGITNSGALDQSGAATLSGETTVSGVVGQTYAQKTGASSYTIAVTDRYITVNSSSSSVTLTATGALPGMVQTIVNQASTSLVIKNPGGSTNCTIDGGTGSHWVDMLWDGSAFFALRYGGVLT